MKRFNVRVYGIWIQDGKLLVSDEFRMGMRMTKLPGGGVEFGEGLEAALKREWMEELGFEIEVGDIFYVNPFLQVSAFNQNEEVLGMYFPVYVSKYKPEKISDKPFDFAEGEGDKQSFRWISFEQLQVQDFTFPIDQAMCEELLKVKLLNWSQE